MATIKDALYAAVGKRKMGALEYEVQQVGNKFRCQVSLTGVNYTGMGMSLNKKDSQTNAARDLGQHLIREGLIAPADLPGLNAQQLESTSIPGSIGSYNAPYSAGSNAPYSTGANASGFQEYHDQAQQRPPCQQEPKSYYEEYVQQRADEIEKSEAVDLTSDIHGGWNLNNCKKALNEFLQSRRMQVATYKTRRNESSNNANFVAELEIYVLELQKKVRGRGEASTKKNAESECALTLVRQLYHLGVLKKSNEPISNKKKNAEDLPPIPVTINEELIERLTKYLSDVGVHLNDVDYSVATPDARITLLTDQRLSEFPITEKPKKSALISFAPPSQNWNCWRSANIDEEPLAFMTIEAISNDLLMREKAKVHDPEIVQKRRSLPVFNHRDEILKIIEENSVVLIKGTTGCGKSTQICQFLLDDYLQKGKGAEFNCFVSQPRRISAISLAERVANERCEEIGDSVGFGVRFESVTPRPYGSVMFVTVGTLLKKLEFGLRGVSHVIIDEIHERDINTDFILIIVRDMVMAYPKLRVILMSATIETGMFTNYFKTNAIIDIEQRVFSVQHFYLEDVIAMLTYVPPENEKKKKKRNKKDKEPEKTDADNEDEELGTVEDKNLNLELANDVPENVRFSLSQMDERQIPIDVILHLLLDIVQNGLSGSVLVFLPGWNSIQAALSTFQSHPILGDGSKYLLLPLHSQLPFTEQRKVFQNVGSNQRKIILSTNIAETSITIDDVVYVIDSCRAREKMHTSRNNMVHYATVWASRNSLVQRRGRAGRVREGFCFHLCTKARYDALDEHRTAEMLRTPLHEITLMIKLLRLGAVGDFLERAIEPPPLDAIIEAEVLLREMGALDSELELTALGKIIARLPVDPRIGKSIVLGAVLNVGDMMCTMAAATSFNSPFVPLDRMQNRLAICHRRFSGRRFSDHVGIIKANNDFAQQTEIGKSAETNFCNRQNLSPIVLSMTSEAKLQMRDVLVNYCGFSEHLFAPHAIDVEGIEPQVDTLLGLLVYAFYPNVCYTAGDKRKVFTLEQSTALMSKISVCFPLRLGETIKFPSPLLVFTEKIRTNVISAKQLSMITPLHMLLFGSRRVDCVGSKTVRLDDMILLEMPPEDAAKLVALRPCIESLIIRSTIEPSILEEKSDLDKELEELIRQLCGEDAWNGTRAQPRMHPIPYVEYQQRNRAKHHHHFQGGGQGQRNQLPPLERPSQFPDQRNTGFSRGGYRGGYRGNERPVYSQEAGGFRGRGRGNYDNQNYRAGRGVPYGNRGNYGAPSNRGGQNTPYSSYGQPPSSFGNFNQPRGGRPTHPSPFHVNRQDASIPFKRPRNDDNGLLNGAPVPPSS